MGRRTLVVRPRADGRVDLDRAHWGVDGDPVGTARPLWTDRSPAAVWTTLDAGTDRLVVDGTVYCVCWLDPTLAEPADVAVASAPDLDALRRWWVETKSRACTDLAERGRDPAVVRRGLGLALARRATALYLPGDTSFIQGDR